jgi:hypothetical protein
LVAAKFHRQVSSFLIVVIVFVLSSFVIGNVIVVIVNVCGVIVNISGYIVVAIAIVALSSFVINY